MKGYRFLNEDNSDRGKIGHIDYHQKWCVNFKGASFHIDSRLSGFTATIHANERPNRKTTVTACDGSCENATEIPSEIWNEAKPQFNTLKQASETKASSLPGVTKEQLDLENPAGHYSGA